MADSDIESLKATNLFSVTGLNIVITGGGSGLGAYMTRALAANGASKIFILGRRAEALERTQKSLPSSLHSTVVPVVADVISKESLASAYDQVKSQVSQIDVLVCNSGVSGPSVQVFNDDRSPVDFETLQKSMLSVSEEDVTNVYRVNLTGIHLTVATFLPLLHAANQTRPEPNASNFKPRPQIITTSSIAAFNRRPLGSLTYGPSKAGVVHLTKMLATTLIPYDIRCNTIAPGLYLSEMTQGSMDKQGKTEKHNVEGTWGKEVIPATRSGDEADMAGTVLWLCSRAGGYVNGDVVVTDGGRLGAVPGSY